MYMLTLCCCHEILHPSDLGCWHTIRLFPAAHVFHWDLQPRTRAHISTCLQEVDESASGVVVTGDAFDTCDGPVNSFFVSPFVCGTDPFLWRELHEAVCAALQLLTNMSTDQAEKDVGSMYEEVTEVETEEALQAVGLRAAPGALVWLTASQKAAVDELMVELEETLAFDVGEWFLVDSLLRAERANRKGWQS